MWCCVVKLFLCVVVCAAVHTHVFVCVCDVLCDGVCFVVLCLLRVLGGGRVVCAVTY